MSYSLSNEPACSPGATCERVRVGKMVKKRLKYGLFTHFFAPSGAV